MLKVSIIVPAYNEEASLAKALEGLSRQSYPNYELLVVDNNSKDRTNEIAKKFTANVFLETEKGYIHAVQRGIREAKGDLLTICDADTVYPATWLTQVVPHFEKDEQVMVVYGTADTYDAPAWQNRLNGVLYTWFLQLSRLMGMENTSGFNFIFRSTAYHKVGGYQTDFKKMSPDIDLGKRLGTLGRVVLDTRIKVSSSYRRFQKGGFLKTTFMFAKSWWAMVRGGAPKVSYEEYNK